jgi:alkylhydroperoxidase family enzyme
MTFDDSLSDSDRDLWALPTALVSLMPTQTLLLQQLYGLAWHNADPVALELMRLRTAALLGNVDGQRLRASVASRHGLSEDKIARLAAYATSDEFTPLDREQIGFAEQFVIDVSGTKEAARLLARHVGDDNIRSFVTAYYYVEFMQRLQLVGRHLFGTESQSVPASVLSEVPTTSSITEMVARYADAVSSADELDHITAECVRLRCARTHQCRICQAGRSFDAWADGFDDVMSAKIDRYDVSDLDERYKLALGVTDAIIIRADELDASLVDRVRDVFTPAELAEICLKVTKWSGQKIHIALDTDQNDGVRASDDGFNYFAFDEDGNHQTATLADSQVVSRRLTTF